MLAVHVRRVLFAALLIALLIPLPAVARTHPRPASSGAAPVAKGQLQLFATEAAAQAHCPKDQVVWLNTNSGIYHEKGMRWYGRTKAGAYVCRAEADAAGDRDTRNGQ